MADKTLVYRINFDGLEAQATQIGKVDRELAQLNQTVKAQRDALKQLETFNQQGTQAYKDLTRELGQNVTQQRNLTKVKGDLIRETQNEVKSNKEATGSINQLRAQLALATKEYNALSKAERENLDVGGALQKNIKRTSDELKRLEGAIGDNRRNVGNYTGGLKEAGSALLSSFGIGFGIGAAVSGLVALGKSLAETSKEIKEIQKVLVQTADLTGEALEEATIKVRTLSNTFDKDYNEVLSASTALSKQLGVDTSEALLLIQSGFVNGADANGQFLDQLREYPAQLKEIGVSAQQTIDIIEQTATQGIYSDKGVDAIKEAGLALREQTKATQDALKNAFGTEFTNELLGNINSGTITVFEGIQAISGELGKLEPQSKEVGAVIADVFKGAGEDAGLAYLTSLKDIGSETKVVSAATQELIDVQERNLRLTEASIRVENFFAGAIGSVKDGLIEYTDNLLTVAQNGGALDKYLALVSGGIFVNEDYAQSLRDASKAQEEYEQSIQKLIKTDSVDELVRRIALLNQVVAEGKDIFGVAGFAIQEYEKALVKSGENITGTATETRTLENLTKQLAEAQEGLNKAIIGSTSFNEYTARVKSLKEEIERITNPTAQGSINAFQKRVAELQKQLNSSNSPARIRELTREIELLNAQIAALQTAQDFSLPEIVDETVPDTWDKANKGAVEYLDTQRKIREENEKYLDGLEKQALANLEADIPLPPDIKTATERRKEEADAAEQLLAFTNDFLNQIGALRQAESDREIGRIENEREARVRAIEESTLSEEEKAQRIVKINKEQDAKVIAEKKKAAEQQRKIALASIAIDTARGIAGAVASGAGVPFPANIGAILSGIAAVISGILQARAAIQSAPEFEQGGIVGGFIQGKSHAQGGVPIEAEGGEIIVNKGIQQRPDFVRAISEMNYLTGGKRFATGGIVQPRFTPQGTALAAQTVSGNQQVNVNIPPIQVVNNVTDTSSQQAQIIQIQSDTRIGR